MDLKKNLLNIHGKSLFDKVVLFESDDWGMIRTQSKRSLSVLRSKGYPVENCIYNRFDSIERNQDLIGLFSVLAKYKGSNGNPAKFTLNNVVANPDFEKIKDSNFEEYFYEPFITTLEHYAETYDVKELFRQGIEEGVIQVQFHGREHVNVNRWLEALQEGDRRFIDAFQERQYTVAGQGKTSGRKDYLDAFGRAYRKELVSEESIIDSGLKLFREIWGFQTKSFIAPCYIWHSDIERYLFQRGVKYIQGTHVQRIPVDGLELRIKKKYHWQGRKNISGMRSMVRNVMFEPAEHGSKPSVVDQTLKEIELAFRWRKAAVVSSHRVNYIGRLDEANRSKNLKLLDLLLSRLVQKYPDVIFMSTDELGDMYVP